MHNKFEYITFCVVTMSVLSMIVVFWMFNNADMIVKRNERSIVDAKPNRFNLTHVIIPFHVKQIENLFDNLRHWVKYKPCLDERDHLKAYMPKLIFFFAYSSTANVNFIKSDLQNLNDLLRCFGNGRRVDIMEYKLEQEDDQHLKGSQLMFEYMLDKKHPLLSSASYVFYMEPDCRPVKSNWLVGLDNEIGRGSSFWIKGSIYRGWTEYNSNYLPNKFHINGNAIYNLGDGKLRDFYFNTIKPYIIVRYKIGAYDTNIFHYLLDLANYHTVRHIVHKFQFTNAIQNLWHQAFNLTDLLTANPETYFVHGGYPNIYWTTWNSVPYI